MQYTSNLNLKKPEGTDTVNINDFNDNADIIDSEITGIKAGTTKVKAAETADNATNAVKLGGQLPSYYAKKTEVDAKETPAGAQAKADAAEASAKAYTDENKYTHPSTHPASMITESTTKRFVSDTEKSTWNAKETPAGAQAKANTAESNAKSYADTVGASAITSANSYTDQEVAEVSQALNAHKADKVQHIPYVVAAGSANAYAVTISGITAYQEGFAVAVKINVDNTGPSTLNVNGLGAAAIKKPNGNDVSAGNLKAESVYTVRYNGTNFILQGSDAAGNATPGDVLSGKTFTNDQGEQTGIMPNHGQQIITPGTSNIVIPAGYHDGTGYVVGDANLVAENIRSDVSIFGVTGTAVPYKEAEGSVRVLNTDPITVTGLAFTPKVVFIRYKYEEHTLPYVCAYTEAVGSSSDYIINWHRNPVGSQLDNQYPSFSVSSGQFSFRVPKSSYVPGTAYWKAYGT